MTKYKNHGHTQEKFKKLCEAIQKRYSKDTEVHLILTGKPSGMSFAQILPLKIHAKLKKGVKTLTNDAIGI